MTRLGDAAPVIRGEDALTYRRLVAIARNEAKVAITAAAEAKLRNGRGIVEGIIASGERSYGINTGLGALSEIVLSGAQLSRDTMMGDACGIGDKRRSGFAAAPCDPTPGRPAH